MFRLWRSEKHIQKLLDDYLRQVTVTLNGLKEIFPRCLDGTHAQLDDLSNPVHKLESVADDMRRNLERELNSGRLLPESRAEVLALVESIDRIPNIAENVVDLFAIQQVEVPEALREDVRKLLLKTLETCAAMAETVKLLLEDMQKIRELADEVDRFESECDRIERRLLRQIFGLDLELARKLHLRDLVRTIGRLADQAENVSDMVQWMALKRRP
ncbi:MAG: DUF47 domain-containing protein [Candidatus Krumholzibacteriia bacterium]